MGQIGDKFNEAFRDYVADGVPSSGASEPSKTEIRELGALIDGVVTGLATGVQRYATKAAMDAVTTAPNGQLANVYLNNDDASDPENGVYQSNGGVWARADWYALALADVVQPLVDEAEAFSLEFANSVGRTNGFPDPFFREIRSLTKDFRGRQRFMNPENWSKLVPSTVYDGLALEAASATPTKGFRIYMDELGAVVDDVIQLGAEVTGGGATVALFYRFYSATGAALTAQAPIGTAFVSAATPTVRSGGAVVPAGATEVRFYLGTSGAASNVQVQSVSARKQTATLPTKPLQTETQARLAALQRKADHALLGNPVWDSITATAQPVVAGEVPRTTIYTGFGDVYSIAELTAEGPFNAVRVPRLSQTDAPVIWDTIKVVVRQGASGAADDAGSAIAAVGSLKVEPGQASLTDAVIVLRDPVTGALLDDVLPLLTAAEAVIFVYARTAGGLPASLNQPVGTMTARAGRTYYLAGTQDPLTAAFSALSGNPSIAIGRALVSNPREGGQASRALLAEARAPDLTAERADMARMRRLRLALRQLKAGIATALDIAFIGDSWTARQQRGVERVTDALIADYGDGGAGWIGFGFSGSTNGNARSAYTVGRTGAGWTSSYHVGSASPDIAHATSSTVGDKITVAGPDASLIAASILFFLGTADGNARYRWNGGAWAALSVTGTVGALLTAGLAGAPGAGAWTLEIEIVSGTCSLAGLNAVAATGVRVHKFGSFGATTGDWVEPDAVQWQTGIAALGVEAAFIMLGVNDKAQGRTPAAAAADLTALIDRLRAAVPGIDICVVMPPEVPFVGTSGTTVYSFTMAEYAARFADVARAKGCAWINLQPAFGVAVSDYEDGSALPLLASDDVHPTDDGGGVVIADTIMRAIAL